MVQRTYIGLGRGDAALRHFEDLTPYARRLYALQAECRHETADWSALGVAIAGLETTAYHFTRRRRFYDHLVGETRTAVELGNGRLSDRAEAVREFEALRPYNKALIDLRGRCRPFGPDYLALNIASEGLLTAVVHFTGDERFYAAAPCGPFRG